IDLDGVAHLEFVCPPWAGKFPQRHAAFGLEPDIDDARSFSMPATGPLMTEPSCQLPWSKDSSSILAKSSGEGRATLALAVAAMKSPERATGGWSCAASFPFGPKAP